MDVISIWSDIIIVEISLVVVAISAALFRQAMGYQEIVNKDVEVVRALLWVRRCPGEGPLNGNSHGCYRQESHAREGGW